MLEMTLDRNGWVSVETDEWIKGRTNGECEAAEEAYSAWHDATDHDNHDDLIEWAESIGATGLYGERPFTAVSYNEDNFLSEDIMVTLVHAEEWGSLMIVQDGVFTSSRPRFYVFIGDDDSDAYDWASGWAACSLQGPWKGGACDAELILESACKLWQNGGGMTVDVSDVIHDEQGDFDYGLGPYAVCPRCRMGELTFYAS